MKAFILSLSFLFSTALFAQTEFCNPAHFQILNKAVGEGSEKVEELLTLETPNLFCEVTTNNDLAFASVCGNFDYTEYNFKVVVGGTTINAIVHDGKISCSKFKRTDLVEASFSK